jgi:hypothetical protein
MDSKDIDIIIDSKEDKQITEIRGMLKEILKNEFIIFVKDMSINLKYNYTNYNIKNVYNNALNYLLTKDYNFITNKKKEFDTLLELLNKPNYEELFFSKYKNNNAINILQEILIYYLVSSYNKDAFDNIMIDNNICSLILCIFTKIDNFNMDMLPCDEMNWISNSERLLESKVIDESTSELSPSEIREHINNIIENNTILLAEYRYTSYAICIGILCYAMGKISN